MKLTYLAVVIATVLLALPPEPADVRFRAAQQKETVEGDLHSAIKMYEALAEDPATPPVIAARSLLRIGVCHQRMGSPDASKAFERVVSRFSEQTEIAGEAQTRLAALTSGPNTKKQISSRRLTKPLTTFQIVTVSRDGRYAAYVRRQQSIPLLLDLVEGTERDLGAPGQRLVPLEDFSSSAAISPDGSQAAFNHCRGMKCELKMIGVQAAEAKTLAAGLAPFLIRDWSRDGSMLLLQGQTKDESWILVNTLTGKTQAAPLPPGVAMGVVSTEQRHDQARISPDAKWVAFTKTESSDRRKSRVLITSVDGRAQSLVSDEAADAYVFGWSVSGNELFFVSDRAGSYDLWVASIRDGKPTGMPKLSRKNFGLAHGTGVSDIGNLYYSVVSDVGEATVADLDIPGAAIRTPRAVSQGAGVITARVTYSPDGRQLLLNRLLPPYFRSAAVIRDLNTGREQEVKPPAEYLGPGKNGVHLYQACWAPDGRSLCFGIMRNGPWRLVVSDPVSRVASAHVQTSHPIYNWPVLLPDASTAIVAKGGNLMNFSPIVSLNLRSGAEREICRSIPGGFAVSADGSHVACAGTDDTVRVIPSRGGAGREIAKARNLGPLVWAPDGKHLIYTAADAYWIVNVDGGARRRMTVPFDRYCRMSIHPGAREIASSCNGSSTELWVLENVAPAAN